MKSRLLGALVAACVLLPAGNALADTVTVTENDITRQAINTAPTDNWVFYTRDGGTGAFRIGPATPPLGAGSFEISTPGGNDKGQLFNYDQVGTALADVNAISYSTYRSSGSLQQVTALNLEADFNGPADGGFTTLVFEPVYNTDQGPVVSGQWQSWDAYNGGQGRWWSTKQIPGLCAFDCFATWDEIVAANPDATVLGGFGLNQGGGNPGLTAASDALTFGTSASSTTWDFEPNGDNCKNGAWKNSTAPVFKNQGDCVSYVATGGRH